MRVKALAECAAVVLLCAATVSCAFKGSAAAERNPEETANGFEHAGRTKAQLIPARLRQGLLNREFPEGMGVADALEAFRAATVALPEERRRLADGMVKAITKDGVDRHEFLEYVPYLQTFQAHEQLTTLLLHNPGEDDYWIECCFYQAVLDALYACGTQADAARLVKEAPERDRKVFFDLAEEIEKRAAKQEMGKHLRPGGRE